MIVHGEAKKIGFYHHASWNPGQYVTITAAWMSRSSNKEFLT
jgi:hypothetical protein